MERFQSDVALLSAAPGVSQRRGLSSFLTGLVVPQSPTLLEEEAAGRTSPAVRTLKSLGRTLVEKNFDAVIALTPFWVPSGGFFVDDAPHHKTVLDYRGYSVDTTYDAPGHPVLARRLIEEGQAAGLAVSSKRYGVDHAAGVPLTFLSLEKTLPLVMVSSSEVPSGACLAFGQVLARVVERWGGRVLLLCGGGLSHNLTACLSYEDCVGAVVFDQLVLRHLKEGRGEELTQIDPFWVEVGNPAAKMRDLFIFLGALGKNRKAHVHAYEGAPGVGWAVISF